MANIIDSLVVTLGLDNSKFKKNIKDSEKTQNEFAHKTHTIHKKQHEDERKEETRREKFHRLLMERNKQTLEGFTKLRNQTLAFLAVFTAGKGLIDFASDTITSVSAMGRLADNFDTNISKLGGWELAMKNAGGTAQDVGALYSKAADAVGSNSLGLPDETAKGLRVMAGQARLNGMPGFNVEKNFASVKDFLLGMNEVISAWYKKNPVQAHTMAKHYLGTSDAAFNLLKQSDLPAQLKRNEPIEGFSERQRKNAQKTLEQWNDFSARLGKIGRVVAVELTPSILTVLDTFAKWAASKKNIDKLTTSVEGLGKSINKIDWQSVQAGFNGMLQAGGWFFRGVINGVKLINFVADWGGGQLAQMESEHNIASQMAYYKNIRPGGGLYNQPKAITVAVGDVNVTVPAGTTNPATFGKLLSGALVDHTKTSLTALSNSGQ